MPPYYQATCSLSIQAPPEKIYEALTDWNLRSQWRKGLGVTWEGNSKAFIGQKVTFRVGSGTPFSFRVTGLEPPNRLFMEYLDKPLRGRHALEILPDKTGCQVSFHWMKVEPAGWLARTYFTLGLGTRSHAKRAMETLRLLKNHLEKE
jgi:uncharacterized protein YndB with AHSA1/START domain